MSLLSKITLVGMLTATSFLFANDEKKEAGVALIFESASVMGYSTDGTGIGVQGTYYKKIEEKVYVGGGAELNIISYTGSTNASIDFDALGGYQITPEIFVNASLGLLLYMGDGDSDLSIAYGLGGTYTYEKKHLASQLSHLKPSLISQFFT